MLDHDEEALRNYDIETHCFTRFEEDRETVDEIKRLAAILSDIA